MAKHHVKTHHNRHHGKERLGISDVGFYRLDAFLSLDEVSKH